MAHGRGLHEASVDHVEAVAWLEGPAHQGPRARKINHAHPGNTDSNDADPSTESIGDRGWANVGPCLARHCAPGGHVR